MKNLLITAAIIIASGTSAMAAQCSANNKITEAEVLASQKAWAEGIVAIGEANDHEKAAHRMIDKLYGYNMGPVLFKPTRASVVEFRDTKEEALSYFVKGIEPEDQGFALTPFTNVRFDNKDIVTNCGFAMAQGNYYFTTTNGEEIKVNYSFGYVKDKNGNLKITLHHSSLPFNPA